MIKENPIYSERADVEFNANDVMGIEIANIPIEDPHPEPYETELFVFDWTLKFKLADGREIQFGYYCDKDQAVTEACWYARNCWGSD